MLVPESVLSMINGRPPTRAYSGATSISTAPYAPAYEFPPVQNQPYHIIHHESLLRDMMDDLRVYLPTSPGGNIDSPLELLVYLNKLNAESDVSSLDRQLSKEESTKEYWLEIFTIIRDCVAAVERSGNIPCTLVPTMVCGQTPDGILAPYPGGKPMVHVEHKSWAVFERFSTKILDLAKANEGSGTKLVMSSGGEQGFRSIIYKIGVSMITNNVPYAILFGGEKFMIFSLFASPTNSRMPRQGLFCSAIISVNSATEPLIPLVTHMLVGRGSGRPTMPRYRAKVPVCDDKPILGEGHKLHRSARSISARHIEKLNHDFTNLTFSFYYSGPVEDTRVFTLNRQFVRHAAMSRDTMASSTSSSIGSITPQQVQTPWAPQVIVQHDEDQQIPSINHVLKPLAKSEDDNLLPLKLWEEIGHGVTGHTFFASTLDSQEQCVIKLASSPDGRWMLQHETEIYDTLKSLQGNIIPQVYGLFTSEWTFALVMEDMGDVLENMKDLSLSQRVALQKDLELIHQQGVIHGDLRVPNLTIKDGRPYIIDFSHASRHRCPGPQQCDELLTSQDFFQLDGSNTN